MRMRRLVLVNAPRKLGSMPFLRKAFSTLFFASGLTEASIVPVDDMASACSSERLKIFCKVCISFGIGISLKPTLEASAISFNAAVKPPSVVSCIACTPPVSVRSKASFMQLCMVTRLASSRVF